VRPAVITAAALVVCWGSFAEAAEADEEHRLRLEVPSFESADGLLSVEPVVLVQPMLLLHVDRSNEPETEGSGFALRKGEAGIKAHVGRAVFFKLVGALEHGEAVLVDAYVHIDPFEGALALRTGFFKPPYCRQFLVPDARRQMADNAVALTLVQPGEQLGVQLGGTPFDVFDYRVGVWAAGSGGFAAITGASDDPVVGGRLSVHPLGPVGAEEEPDLVRTPDPRFSVGGAVIYDRRDDRIVPLAGIGSTSYSDNRLRVGGELAAKWRGASLASEIFFSRVWVADDTPVEVADRLPPVRGLGGYVQAGYFVLPRRLEVAMRLDVVDADIEIQGWGMHPAAGVQIYAVGHMIKVMVMYRLNLSVMDPYPDGSPYHTPTTHDALLVLQGAF
jgi:hypothetical protein